MQLILSIQGRLIPPIYQIIVRYAALALSNMWNPFAMLGPEAGEDMRIIIIMKPIFDLSD